MDETERLSGFFIVTQVGNIGSQKVNFNWNKSGVSYNINTLLSYCGKWYIIRIIRICRLYDLAGINRA